MTFSIDTTTYNKAKDFPLPANPRTAKPGYDRRMAAVSSIVMHSTNNKAKKTPFINEASFIYASKDISAHYLVGKDGKIVEFLDPAKYLAWHAGAAIPAYQNAYSIGIELHVSVGESPTPIQLDAAAWLCREMMRRFHIPYSMIDTHRYIAIPGPTSTNDRTKWRKSDPEGWSDAAFYAWRAMLVNGPRFYRVRGLPTYHDSLLRDPTGEYLAPDITIEVDRTHDEQPADYAPSAAHLKTGNFIDLNGTEKV